MIHIKVKLYRSIKDRTVGLIGKDKAEPVMFLTRYGIHTFGLKFPIDVVILDSKNKVTRIAKNLSPNRFFVWPIKYNKVIELPGGFVAKHKIQIGTILFLSLFKNRS